MWPDYCKKETLAKRLDLKTGAIDQYVKRGLLPPPIHFGEAELWHWPTVDAAIRGRKTEDTIDDPYMLGVRRAAEAAPARQAGQKQIGPALPLSDAPPRHRQS